MIECVPNISEGRDLRVIEAITSSIEAIPGVYLLGVDAGRGANRTVITFSGHEEPVYQAAFALYKTATALIDMSKHSGAHPRIGAVDVCPFVPLTGSDMETCKAISQKLAKAVSKEFDIPVFLYADAALTKERSNLAYIRRGQYEGLEKKLAHKSIQPDFGDSFNPKFGATAIGAREILVAYNISLNTTDIKLVKSIAEKIRETGFIVKDDRGKKIHHPGLLKNVRALGWYIEEYGLCQVSMNILDYKSNPIRHIFDLVQAEARQKGLTVAGSEVIGLLPLDALVDKNLSTSKNLEACLKEEINYLGLNLHKHFNPEEKIIELRLADLLDKGKKK